MEPGRTGQSETCHEYIWGLELEKDSEISDTAHQGLKKVESHIEEKQNFQPV